MKTENASQRQCLARALGLRPLDRVQVNSREQISEMRFSYRRNEPSALPFAYFQFVREDGMLCVSSPGGFLMYVQPEDVCDVRHGTPILVRSMSEERFVERLKIPHGERRLVPGEDEYEDAYVIRVMKDKWGRVDVVYVRFLDEKLNKKGSTFINPVREQDRDMLNEIANRTVMPVVNYKSAASYTADKGIKKEADLARGIASGFFTTALRGDAETAKRLASVDAETKPMTRVVLNRLISKSGIVMPRWNSEF